MSGIKELPDVREPLAIRGYAVFVSGTTNRLEKRFSASRFCV
jgi:hypothetical protein